MNVNATNFKFSSPVYLPQGEFAIVISASDPDYEVYTAILGETILGGTSIVSQQPYAGVFFKSSDALAYTPIQTEDLMFRINKCVFTTGVTGTLTLQANTAANVFFDTEFVNSQEVLYGPLTSIQWSEKTTANASNVLGSFVRVEANQNNTEAQRMVILASPSGENGKYYAQASMLTLDANVSPMIDLTRAAVFAIENFINNDASNETGSRGGNADTRYVSRTVSLAAGFDAGSLQVYLTAMKPVGSNILVYAKLLNRYDPDPFVNKNWTLLQQVSSATLFSPTINDFYEFQYQFSATSDDIPYTSATTGVLYSTFSTFAIKIVLLASNTTQTPIIEDMRAIALPAD